MNGLKVVSWGDTTGYAIAGRGYVRALGEAGVDLTWEAMLPVAGGYDVVHPLESPAPELAPWFDKDIPYDTVLVHSVPEYYDGVLEREQREGRRVLGYTVWELEELPAHWVPILNRLDGVLVPCTWNAEVFRRSGVTVPIHVVPHLSQFRGLGRAPEEARDRVAALTGLPRSAWEDRENGSPTRVFYTIGYYSHRKAPYLVVDAFREAFGPDDDVVLVVKTSVKDITRPSRRHWRGKFRGRARRHPSPVGAARRRAGDLRRKVVVVADESLTDEEMLALHEVGDCYVSLARTEGWGLGAFEAALRGTPVVMTGYGGQTDFLDADLARLVDFDMVPVHEPTWSANYRPVDRWAEPDVAQAAAHLRAVRADPAAARAAGAELADRLEQRFGTTAVVDAMLRALA